MRIKKNLFVFYKNQLNQLLLELLEDLLLLPEVMLNRVPLFPELFLDQHLEVFKFV